ncbi:MAG: rhodanese-like domain-containing protein [Thermoanaerobaculia bacterium]
MIGAAILGTALAFVAQPSELAARPAGSVTILDARSTSEYRRGHVPGATAIDWTDFRDGWWRTGKLPEDLAALASNLGRYGVDDARPVVVYGNARDGWGEEGRIAWMLAYLGHPEVSILDGGWPAWLEAGLPVSRSSESARPGHFVARPVAGLRASAEDVEAMRQGAGTVLDVRTAAEWDGATPHFEPRGGHVPGAIHLEWKDLLDARGRLDPALARARLRAAGVDPARPVITYCTAGVRAGEAWVLLRALGYADVRNYDGSWYDWSADERRPVSLE